MMLKAFLKKHLSYETQLWLNNLRHLYFTRFSTKSYSQHGEDLVLKSIFSGASQGFYVDIGAHHPFRFSNTYLFYKRGWRGINVDAMPGSMALFNRFRPRDINIECGIAFNGGGSMIYYSFNEPALNGFSPILETKFDNHPTYRLKEKISIPVKTLEHILDEYLPPPTQIDFLSVDVEGLDLEVLRSNNWDKYRPKVILAECWSSKLDEMYQDKIYQLLSSLHYELHSKVANTLIFKEHSQ